MSFTFGSAGSNGGSKQPFGSSSTAQNNGGNSLFGSNTTSAPSPFGQTSATSKPTAGIFGGGNTSGVSAFGAGAGSSAPQAGSIFGANSGPGSSSLFGGSTGNTPTFGAKPGPITSVAGNSSSLFSIPTTSTATSSSPFSFAPKQDGSGTSTAGQSAAPSGGLFSNVTKPTGSNLFGAPTVVSTAAPAGSTTPAPVKTFSINSTTPAGPPPTGNGETLKVPSGSLFSGSNQTSGGLFGGTSTTANTSSTLFSQNPPTTSFPLSKPQPNNTSNTPAPASNVAPVTTSLFGGTSNANPTSSTSISTSIPFSGLGSGAASAAPVTSTTTTTQALGGTPSLFSKTGPSTTATTTIPATTTGSGTTAPALDGLFKKLPASSSNGLPSGSSIAPVGGSTISSSSGPTQPGQSMGASTTGPAPQISRLKNKTMDEIITRWASDLLKYQKEFQEQATKVAEWDRMLVENGDKIQKLYNSTWEAERASTEVERQLSAVESQQLDLTSWLDHYEKDVDEMFARQVGQGESLQGPDQERERTYKLAEKLTDRLDEMGKNLTSMIDAINETSSNLSKSNKTDDPLSHIVRVLNSHLAQLQWIDQNAELLQQKVAEAQKLGQSMSSNEYGGQEMDGADALFRSYNGRR